MLKCNTTCPARPLAGRRGEQCNQDAGQLFLETYCLQIRIAVKVTTYLLEELWELYSTPFQVLPKGYETASGCLFIVQGLGRVFSMWGNRTQILPFLQLLVEEAASEIPLITLCDDAAQEPCRCPNVAFLTCSCTVLLLCSPLPTFLIYMALVRTKLESKLSHTVYITVCTLV